jgi:hypothetical protein
MGHVQSQPLCHVWEGSSTPTQAMTANPLHTGGCHPSLLQSWRTWRALHLPSVVLFVVLAIMMSRREILSPARVMGGRHLRRQRLWAAIIALIGRCFVRLLGEDKETQQGFMCPRIQRKSWVFVAPLKTGCQVPYPKLLLFLGPWAGATDAYHLPCFPNLQLPLSSSQELQA